MNGADRSLRGPVGGTDRARTVVSRSGNCRGGRKTPRNVLDMKAQPVGDTGFVSLKEDFSTFKGNSL
jgi:hypothetical protein